MGICYLKIEKFIVFESFCLEMYYKFCLIFVWNFFRFNCVDKCVKMWNNNGKILLKNMFEIDLFCFNSVGGLEENKMKEKKNCLLMWLILYFVLYSIV